MTKAIATVDGESSAYHPVECLGASPGIVVDFAQHNDFQSLIDLEGVEELTEEFDLFVEFDWLEQKYLRNDTSQI